MIKYSSEAYTKPIWQGDTVEMEMFWPIKKDGEEVKVKLAYPVDEVISLCNSRLEREFVNGRDYTVEDGCIVIPENSEITVTPWEEIILDKPQEGAQLNIEASIAGKYLFFSESSAISDKQCTVKYKHSGKWQGVIPCRPDGKLSKIVEKIKRGDDFTFAFFGDSITVGANSSGTDWINVPPYAPIWPKTVCNELERRYGGKISYINHAVGGKTSDWGVEEFKTLHEGENADLFVVAFGMNDFTNPKFEENIRTIMSYIWEKNPECEIILISTMLPNTYAKGFFNGQDKQEEILEKIAKEYSSVVLAPVTSVHKELLKNKFYFDMTGNCVNHPNDFLAAIYAQTVLAVLD